MSCNSPRNSFVKIGFISFWIIPFRFVLVNFVSIYFVSFRFRFVSVNFVSFRWISFRFISFRFVSFRFRFAFYRYPFSITPLFNLLALRNKLNPKSVLMECMFFSPQFFLYNIYLFTFVFKICLVILVPVMCTVFPKRGNAIFEIG